MTTSAVARAGQGHASRTPTTSLAASVCFGMGTHPGHIHASMGKQRAQLSHNSDDYLCARRLTPAALWFIPTSIRGGGRMCARGEESCSSSTCTGCAQEVECNVDGISDEGKDVRGAAADVRDGAGGRVSNAEDRSVSAVCCSSATQAGPSRYTGSRLSWSFVSV